VVWGDQGIEGHEEGGHGNESAEDAEGGELRG
jgi:hypothetical protein